MSWTMIRCHRIIQTYLWHPHREVKRHALVSTMRCEGDDPANNFDEYSETIAFPSWSESGREILQRQHQSKGIYGEHATTVAEFLSQGFKKLKTRVSIMPEGVGQKAVTYTLVSPAAQ